MAQYKNLSVGLHFELKEVANVQAELERQIEKFVAVIGKIPDYIDMHKRHTADEGIKEVLQEYAKAHNIPVRNFNAKHIGSFGVNSKDASLDQLKRSIDEATEQYKELMAHTVYSDEYLREHSSYNDPREQELVAICGPSIKEYLKQKYLELIDRKHVA